MKAIDGWWYDNVYLGVPDDEDDEECEIDDYDPEDYDSPLEEDYYL